MIARARRRVRRLQWLVGFGTVAIAIAVLLPAVRVGLLADDLFQLAYVDGLYGPKSPLGLYSFALEDADATAAHVARGSLPWWTVPEFRFAHLRPLASVLVWFDLRVLPRGTLWPYVHSMLWLVLLLAAVAHALITIVGRRVALFALPAFAIDEPLAWTVGWLANRCAMVSAVFGLFALVVHVRRRRARSGDRRTFALELALWALAFAAGEYATGVLAIVVTWELLAAKDGLRARLVALVPVATATLGFVVAYLVLGCGVYGATTYVDPLLDPGMFVHELAHRIARTAGEVLLGVPSETERLPARYGWTVIEPLFRGLDRDAIGWALRHAWLVGTMTALVCAGLWRLARMHLRAGERVGSAVLVWGGLAALVPIAAIPPATRSLLVPSLAGAVLFAAVASATLRAWRCRRDPLARRVGLLAASMVLGWQHVVGDAVYEREQLAVIAQAQDAHRSLFDNAQLRGLDLRGRHVVVLAAPDLVATIYGQPMMRLLERPMPATWHALSMGVRPHLVRTLDARTIELSSVGSAMHIELQEILFRAPSDALRTGERVDVGLFAATVLTERAGLGPVAVQFRFDRPLDDPSLVFLQVGPDGLVPFVLPPLGRTRVVQPPRIPSGPR
jgi:hypothetical protein